MPQILTLIAPQDNPALSEAILSQLSNLLSRPATILAEGVAAEFSFDEAPSVEQLYSVQEVISGLPIDTALQPEEGREKKLLIADMDSTIIQQECLDELAAYAGKKDEISAITERAMRGELDFEEALRERVAMLNGLGLENLQATLDECLTLTPGAIELVRTMNARGAITALVSGGFTFFTSRVADMVGFQVNQGNVLATADDKLTGGLDGPILGREAKLEALENLCAKAGLTPDESMAVGDGANDLAMIGAAGTGVALHAKPIVAEQAKVRIDHADLSALLYLQGISKSEFVTV